MFLVPSNFRTSLQEIFSTSGYKKNYINHIKDVVSCSGFKKSIFFYMFRKYNILKVYCKNFRPKYEIFTKLQYIVERAPRLINY